jgi:hypothetical protein
MTREPLHAIAALCATLLVASAVRAEPATGKSAAAKPAAARRSPSIPNWTACTPKLDCVRDSADDMHADQPVALGATFEMVVRGEHQQLFAKNVPALRLGAVLMVDVAWFELFGPAILAFDLGYRLEQSSSSELYDGAVTTALTSHEPYAGANLRVHTDRGLDPLASVYGRIVAGGAFGPLEVRDARSDGRDVDSSGAAFFDLGLGIVLRPVGLLLELGYELAWPRHFELGGTEQALRFERHGFYARSGVVLRVP